MSETLLRLDASANQGTSVTRKLTQQIVDRLAPARIITRDLTAEPLPQIDGAWVSAGARAAQERTEDERARLALSDALIDEIAQADTLVIGVPIHNFSIPTALKAWIDLIARAGETFRYTESGPQGLMTGKRAILAVASGGVPVGSEMDFATGYLKFVLGFVGIDDIQIVAADRMAVNASESLANADRQILALAG